MSQCFELRTSQSLHQVLRHTTYRHDVWQVDFCRSRRRQFNLSLFSSFLQTLHSHWVSSQVSTFVVLEFLSQPVDDYLVEVVTTEVSVTVCRQYFEYTATEFEDRDIECTTTEVEYSYLHVLVSLVDTVSQSSSSRFVYDTLHFQTCNLTSFLSSLTLRVREVSRNCDNRFSYFLAEVVFSSLLHLLKNHSRDFLWSVETAVDVYTWSIVVALNYFIRYARDFLLYLIPIFTHEALD